MTEVETIMISNDVLGVSLDKYKVNPIIIIVTPPPTKRKRNTEPNNSSFLFGFFTSSLMVILSRPRIENAEKSP